MTPERTLAERLRAEADDLSKAGFHTLMSAVHLLREAADALDGKDEHIRAMLGQQPASGARDAGPGRKCPAHVGMHDVFCDMDCNSIEGCKRIKLGIDHPAPVPASPAAEPERVSFEDWMNRRYPKWRTWRKNGPFGLVEQFREVWDASRAALQSQAQDRGRG